MSEKVFVINPQLKMYGGQALHMGEVFELVGLRNDEKLLSGKYCRRLDTDERACDCGRVFAHDFGLNNHRLVSHKGGYEKDALEPDGAPPPPPLEERRGIPPKRLKLGQDPIPPVGMQPEEE